MEWNLSTLDMIIIGTFFGLLVVVGMLMNRIASKGIGDYFLGGKRIPWWVLGASGTASNVDISGTAIIVAFIYSMGLRGFWIEMRGGVGIPLAFLLVFLGKWYRRSKVMTEAEFMKLRFGEGPDGQWARMLSAVANLILTFGMLIYFSKGAGIFLGQFVQLVPDPALNQFICAGILTAIGLAYTVTSGLYGVVFTDVLQELMIIITAVYISVKAYFMVGTEIELPARFTEFSLPFTAEVPNHPEYNMFTFVIMFFILKGILEGMGGLGSYMSQRYYAARNEREAGLLTAEWIFLLSFRWTFIMALAIMGLSIADKVTAAGSPEHVMPLVISNLLPSGIKGIAISGMLAAALSTFDSTVNAGAAYFVKDIYQVRMNPNASEEKLLKVSRLTSLIIAAVAFAASFAIPNINFIWNFINASLLAGMFLPLVLRWFWERLNGYGFAIGTASGLTASLVMMILESTTKTVYPPYVTFPIALFFSLIGCILGTYLTPPTDPRVQENFIQQTRVGGLWNQTKSRLSFDFIRSITIEHLNDIISVVLALPAQICLFFGAMCIITHDWQKAITCGIIFAVCSVGLYFFWYKNLRRPEDTGEEEERVREEEEEEKKAREQWESMREQAIAESRGNL